MAPVTQREHDAVEKQLKDAIQDLYQVMIQVNAFDLAGRPTREVLDMQIQAFTITLRKIHATVSRCTTLPVIPPELVQYVDNGRNPDIYTREFVELARRGNQLMKGKREAFASFRDVLAGEIGRAMPEVRADAVRAVVATGGEASVVGGAEEGKPASGVGMER